MPKGPKGETRPADVIGTAVKVMKIATGQIQEGHGEDSRKDPAAVALGRKGGKKGGRATANKLTPAERSQIARLAAQARWKKERG